MNCPSDGGLAIMGAVLGWGEVEVHNGGFRAQHAEVLCLVCSLDEPTLHRVIAEHVADRYDVPVLSIEKAEALAKEMGREVPPEMIPESGDPNVTISGSVIRASSNPFAVPWTSTTSGWPEPPKPRLTSRVLGRLIRDLAPRPQTLDGLTITDAHLRLASGFRMSSGSISRSLVESVGFHPGLVARGLVVIGYICGFACAAVGAALGGLL